MELCNFCYETSWLEKAKSIGIDSFWYKEASKETILEIMERTMNGESIYPDKTPDVKIGHANSNEFTKRRLHISENTVKQHIRHMMEKTGCEAVHNLLLKQE